MTYCSFLPLILSFKIFTIRDLPCNFLSKNYTKFTAHIFLPSSDNPILDTCLDLDWACSVKICIFEEKRAHIIFLLKSHFFKLTRFCVVYPPPSFLSILTCPIFVFVRSFLSLCSFVCRLFSISHIFAFVSFQLKIFPLRIISQLVFCYVTFISVALDNFSWKRWKTFLWVLNCLVIFNFS